MHQNDWQGEIKIEFIINELNIGDLSLVKYEGTKRFFYETATSGYSQVAFSILAIARASLIGDIN